MVRKKAITVKDKRTEQEKLWDMFNKNPMIKPLADIFRFNLQTMAEQDDLALSIDTFFKKAGLKLILLGRKSDLEYDYWLVEACKPKVKKNENKNPNPEA